MRRLLCVVLLSFSALLIGSAGGCSSAVATSLCNDACDDYNSFRCGTTCNCSACNVAPPECDSYFDCVQQSHSCLDIGVSCTIPTQCQSFVNANCS